LVRNYEAKVISRVKRQHDYKKIMSIVLIAAVLQFLAIESILVINGRSDTDTETDYLIILGAGLKGETPSPILYRRLDAGVDYLLKCPGAQVVVSGGQGRGEEITEAEAMRRYLVSKGITQDRIIVENRSTSTMENFKYSKKLIEQQSGKTVSEITLITSNFHVFRAKMLAGRNNLKSYAISCKTPAMVTVQMYIREYFALFKSFAVDR
jgi:uncharacterized SAM-binding protein YcdF (DUF218 family)